MNDTVAYRSVNEAMQLSASEGIVRISFKIDLSRWSQMNMDLPSARELASKLQKTIEAAEFLQRLEDK